MSAPGGNALSDQQVDIIATRLAERLSAPTLARAEIPTSRGTPAVVAGGVLGAVISTVPATPR